MNKLANIASPLAQVETTSRRLMMPRLAVLMLLEYMILGSWFATVGLVLVEHGLGAIIGTLFAVAAVAGVISPMFIGALADRFFPPHRMLSGLHLIGGVILLFVPGAITSGDGTIMLVLVFVYMLAFQPTIALTNSITFIHLGKQQNRFAYIRVFGTIGWLLAGVFIGTQGLSASPYLFLVTAGASVVLGLYSLTLPHTPPLQKGVKFRVGDVIGIQAFSLFRRRNYVIFALCCVLTFIPIAIYNSYGSAFLGDVGIKDVATVLAIGQLTELLFIPLIPFVIRKIGIKYAMLVGMVTWGARYIVLIIATGGNVAWAIAAVALHGICSDFFAVTGAIYTERVAPAMKAQAQSLYFLLTQGLGVAFGAMVAGAIFNSTVGAKAASGTLADWTLLFVVPILVAVVTALVFLIGFSGREIGPRQGPIAEPAEEARPKEASLPM
ncbi:nucleoside transporter [Paenarthrobacter nicotinovorans]|uniref:MFS transporter n=1 Tax=Paenarthrobacter nicotinovorans TaxID=29320 RepID=UPI002781D448|nr:MFS transporter [Paenarthrobacter nicotinovorans]MDP9933804.1 nucleoside transporter [Paenarthrobacter nicotinovorans]